MRALVICLFLVGCATSPNDLLGKPLEDAISEYGQPVTAVDYEGARAFFFEKGKRSEIKKNKKLLDPDMPIPATDYVIRDCVYIMNSTWTNTREEWVIRSVEPTNTCKENK